MYDKLLLIPGPTNISEGVREAMSRPQLPHVGSEFYSTFKEIVGLARYVFKNERGTQFVFTGTGTTGMESSVVSLVSHGNRTLTVSTGYFGQRMLLINKLHGAKADNLDFTDGKAADPDILRKELRKTKYKVVFVTHVDTSSSVVNPIEDLVAECSKAGVLSVIDSVCAAGGVPLDFDRLGADIVFTASQKAIAAPPGAVLIAASQRAIEHMEKRKAPIESYYMDLLRWKPVMEDPKTYLATPATQILLALRQAMVELKEEGLENRWARHKKLGAVARDKVAELGQKFVAAEGHRSDTVTSFWVEGGKAAEIQEGLEREHNIVIARGIYENRDKMLRIGHFGILQVDRLTSAMESMGDIMAKVGAKKVAPHANRRRKR